MKAYAQVLWRWPLIGIVRTGPSTDASRAPYNFAVVFVQRWRIPFVGRKSATIWALVATPPHCESCEWQVKFRMSAARAIMDLLRADFGLESDWERFDESGKKLRSVGR